MSYARAEAEFHAAVHRRLDAALARSHAVIERSRQTIEPCDALMAEVMEQVGQRASPDPLLHPLSEGEEVG